LVLPENLFAVAVVGRESEAHPAFSISSAAAEEGRAGIWQRRFWEHVIRDEGDYERHVDYIHYNPVKMQTAGCALLSRPTALMDVLQPSLMDTVNLIRQMS